MYLCAVSDLNTGELQEFRAALAELTRRPAGKMREGLTAVSPPGSALSAANSVAVNVGTTALEIAGNKLAADQAPDICDRPGRIAC